MKRIGNPEDSKALWFSEESDWCTAEGHSIVIWDNCIITEKEYKDFIEFVNEEISSEVEPVGSFITEDGIDSFVFLLKSNIPQFSIWRFNLPGMRWWFDAFSEINGGRIVKDSELTPIINKLCLTITGAN